MNIYTTKLLSKKELAHDMLELTIEKPQGFDFSSGQFLQILIPLNEKNIPRAYSICSTPSDEHIILCIKLREDGIGSNYIKNIQEHDELQLRGPAGHFILSKDVPLFCVATGTGIAPIISLIRTQLEDIKSNTSIHLLFGLRSQQDLFWQDKFQKLADTHNNFTFQITLSQPEDGWEGLDGRVTAHIPHLDSNTHVYLCGSPAMVQEVKKIVMNNGVDTEKIHFEMF